MLRWFSNICIKSRKSNDKPFIFIPFVCLYVNENMPFECWNLFMWSDQCGLNEWIIRINKDVRCEICGPPALYSKHDFGSGWIEIELSSNCRPEWKWMEKQVMMSLDLYVFLRLTFRQNGEIMFLLWYFDGDDGTTTKNVDHVIYLVLLFTLNEIVKHKNCIQQDLSISFYQYHPYEYLCSLFNAPQNQDSSNFICFSSVRFGSFRLLFFQLTTLHTHTYFNSLFILCLFIYFKLNYWFYGNRRNCSSPFLCTTTINMTLQKHMNWKKNLFIWKKCHANTAERERERKGSIEFYEA